MQRGYWRFTGRSTMRTSPSSGGHSRWHEPSYEVKVRGTAFLWGSAGINTDITFEKPLVLHILNDLFGETVTLGTQKASHTRQVMGTIEPGEFVSIPLQGISGIFASCKQETTVS